jgi:hypothetical protein
MFVENIQILQQNMTSVPAMILKLLAWKVAKMMREQLLSTLRNNGRNEGLNL